jgi:hypothetical protein
MKGRRCHDSGVTTGEEVFFVVAEEEDSASVVGVTDGGRGG